MKSAGWAVWPLVLIFALILPVLAFGQVRIRSGGSVLFVVDPTKATPAGKNKAKTPPLTAGQQELLVAAKDGMPRCP